MMISPCVAVWRVANVAVGDLSGGAVVNHFTTAVGAHQTSDIVRSPSQYPSGYIYSKTF